MTAIADGKIYLQSYEHSANAPHWQDSKMRCINATTGEEIWAVFGWGNSSPNPVADGYIVYLNAYDMQLYCFGKGPSATSVSTQNDAGGIQIMGSVIDTAAGTNQEEQAGRFPHGVPAVSDASENAWMEYVYTQKPLPTNITGVPVSLDAIDPNGNSIHLGDVTSDANGYYCLLVNPNVLSAGAGTYKVIANFRWIKLLLAITFRILLCSCQYPNISTNRYNSIKLGIHNRFDDVHGYWSSRYNHCNRSSRNYYSLNSQKTTVRHPKTISSFSFFVNFTQVY